MFLAAVGPHMLRATAAVADGLFAHPFLTERYLREVVVPEIDAHRPGGAGEFEIALSPFVARDERDVEAVRRQISFYGSTPSYRPVLERHGWGELQTELNRLSKEGRWDDMVPLVTDEILHEMCAVGTDAEIAATLRTRFGDVAHRLRFNRPGDTPPPARFAGLVRALRA